MFLPVIVAEIRVTRAAGEQQRVVADFAGRGDDPPPRQIDRVDAFLEDADVSVSGEQAANRRCNLGGTEPGHRHLVEQGLEQVVIAPVDQSEVHPGNVTERARGVQARESSAHDHHSACVCAGLHCRPPKATK